jgi:chromosome partitioning protein
MGKVFAFSNQKGGVGKTTSAINLSAYVAKLGKRVLLVDFDPQGNATSGFGVDKQAIDNSVYEVLMGDCGPFDAILKTPFSDLYILPCNINLAGAEIDLVGMSMRESSLKTALAPIVNSFDYIFVDCPPSLGLLTLNALVACDGVIIPIQSEFFALEGLSQLMNTIRIVKQKLNPNIYVNGVILTMFETRTTVSRQVTDEIKKYFGEKVYNIPVPRNVKLVESPSFGVPISVHAPKSNGAAAYEALAKQFLTREGG